MAVSWTDLPVEFKKGVVEKLDFMGRHALKSVSRRDRELVNSVILRIPRVRFAYKDDKCLIVIYTEIEKFLRLELAECKEGTIIHRSESTWDPTQISTKILPSTSPLRQAISIIRSLFSEKSIILEVMEWETDKNKGADEIFENLGGFKIRARKIALCRNTFYKKEQEFVEKLCEIDDLERMESFGLRIDSEHLVPVMSFVMKENDVCGKPHGAVKLTMGYSGYEILEFIDRSANRCKNPALNDPMTTYTDLMLKKKDDLESPLQRSQVKDTVQYAIKTKCGEWSHIIPAKNEKKWKGIFESQTCGMGILCKTHSDPFDYWYHQNLPLRVLREPFWCALASGEGPRYFKELEKLTKKLERNENQKEKVSKILKNSKIGVPSWGFRQVSLGDLMSNHKKNLEKKNKKKMKKLGKKGGLEIVEKSEIIENKPEMEHVATEEQNLEPEKLEIVEPKEVLEPPTPESEKIAPEPVAAPIAVTAPTDTESLTISENIFNYLVLIFVPIVLLFQFYAMIF